MNEKYPRIKMSNEIFDIKVHNMCNLNKVWWVVLRYDGEIKKDFDDYLTQLSILKNKQYWERLVYTDLKGKFYFEELW